MRYIWLALVYTVHALDANASFAADRATLEALREGDMKKLAFHADPQPVTDAAFFLEDDGGMATLAHWQGKYVLLNFWATWCAPCREEMPALNRLQALLGGGRFQVVTLAVGRNPPAAIRRFFAQTGLDRLPPHRDPHSRVARAFGVFGLPATVVLNPNGQEIARLQGDADWSSPQALAVFRALLDLPPEG
ncbi:MAG: TlpA family protein disulfide reductase [Rhodobacteraceae bacterium]|nr:TlpA family protein disulfide reductase [Paracoccaceae bacterium]